MIGELARFFFLLREGKELWVCRGFRFRYLEGRYRRLLCWGRSWAVVSRVGLFGDKLRLRYLLDII